MATPMMSPATLSQAAASTQTLLPSSASKADGAANPRSAGPPVPASYASYFSAGTESSDRGAIADHLPMVRSLAARLHQRLPYHIEIEELISAGTVGLLDAMQRFDAGRQAQFRTYAQFRVRGAMLDSLRALDWGPRALRRKGRELARAAAALSSTLGTAPAEREIAEAMGMDLEGLQRLRGEIAGLKVDRLQDELGEESGTDTLETLPARSEDDPFLQYQGQQMQRLLSAALAQLPEREQRILRLYYYEDLTMREIGALMGVAESRISQLHASAMRRLRGGMSGYRPECAA